jgi:FkbM family methyltransferase
VATAPLARNALVARGWDRAWRALADRAGGETHVRIHGREVEVTVGYAYPAFLRRWPNYNRPLVELVRRVAIAKGRPITFVDVGAAVGDTVLLVAERCPGVLGTLHCVEGDRQFVRMLRHNLKGVEGVQVHNALVSDADGPIAELVRTHPGTASAQGSNVAEAVTLDRLLSSAGGRPIDVLKSDVDGLDGRVLAGARELLRSDQPAVIFEWHPLLYARTGNPWRAPFDLLRSLGYVNFLWFNKFGEFSHSSDGNPANGMADLADACLGGNGPHPDWHFDVVAFVAGLEVDATKLSEACSMGRDRSGKATAR